MSFVNENLSNEKPLRVALIGYGLAGAVFHAPLIASTQGMVVAALVTSDPGRRIQALRDFPNVTLYAAGEGLWREAARYDMVVIDTTNSLHVPPGIAPLNVGMVVVIWRPLTPSG